MKKLSNVKKKHIKALGFNIQKELDSVYEKQHGIPYRIITLKLAKGMGIDWDQLNRECTLIAFSEDNGSIVSKIQITKLKDLKKIIKLLKRETSY